MSKFECNVVTISVIPHPDPETTALECAQIGEYLSVVRKGMFKSGDKAVYLPEGALLPDHVLEDLSLKGKLAGKDKNRIKAKKIRGVLSQGVVYPAKPEWKVGQDVQDVLGVTKWEPKPPPEMKATMDTCANIKIDFDVENLKKYPNVIEPHEEVYITEKIHGCSHISCILPSGEFHENMIDQRVAVCSKNMMAKGMFVKDNQENSNNIYLQVAKQYLLAPKLEGIREQLLGTDETIWILGEVFGHKVQDLQYGASTNQRNYRAFAIKVGDYWLEQKQFFNVCAIAGIPTVPILYQGLFDRDILRDLTDGKETVSGHESHIREGVVVAKAKHQPGTSSCIRLKSVSDAYLLRHGGTEYT